MSQVITKFIANNAVINAKLAQTGALTLLGNNTGSTANVLSLSVAQVQSMLSIPTASSPLPLNAGGTGVSAASANAAFAALSPLTTAGDIIYENSTPAPDRLPIGTNGQVLTVVGGLPAWAASGSGGANTALSNLASVAINTDLLPDGNDTHNIGGSGFAWSEVWSQSYINDSGNISIALTDPNVAFATTNASPSVVSFSNFDNLQLRGNGAAPHSQALQFYDNATSSVNFISLVAPDSLSAPVSFTLPAVDGSNGQFLQTNGSGVLSFQSVPAAAINNKELVTLSSGDITNQFIDLAHVAKTNSISFLVKGGGVQIEGASFDYSVNYTGGAGGNTRITFLNGLATGGASALVAGDVVVSQYQY